MGRHCHELSLTVRIADLDDDTPTEQDAAATWMLGHTERIHFGRPYVKRRELLSDAVVQVPCRYLTRDERGRGAEGRQTVAQCKAHGFEGPVPVATEREVPDLRHGTHKFTVVQQRHLRVMELPIKASVRRTLPVNQPPNPCLEASCRTADNRVGAACCRDLTLDILNDEGDGPLEPLLRARKSPYLCKVKRTDERSVECEVISACGYVGDDGIACVLHNRVRPNGVSAKPELCFEWPDFDDDDEYTGHPGCVFIDD